MNKPSYFMIADRTMSTGSERRHQAFAEMEVVVRRFKDGSGGLDGSEIGEA
jgi:hypothetical protein